MTKVHTSFADILSRLRKNVSLVLGAALVVLLLFEAFVLQQAIAILVNANHTVPIPDTQLVRVNFGLYDQLRQRQTDVNNFVPTPVTAKNPFAPPEIKAKN